MPRSFGSRDLSLRMLHCSARSETDAWNILQKRRIHNCPRRSVSESPLTLGRRQCRDKDCLWMLGPLDICAPLDVMTSGDVERMCPSCGTIRSKFDWPSVAEAVWSFYAQVGARPGSRSISCMHSMRRIFHPPHTVTPHTPQPTPRPGGRPGRPRPDVCVCVCAVRAVGGAMMPPPHLAAHHPNPPHLTPTPPPIRSPHHHRPQLSPIHPTPPHPQIMKSFPELKSD